MPLIEVTLAEGVELMQHGYGACWLMISTR
jgi:hypothetical protein